MGTDHDVHGVSISLSITNVVKFEKTEAETVETFKKERRARERWAEEENLYSLNCQGAVVTVLQGGSEPSGKEIILTLRLCWERSSGTP